MAAILDFYKYMLVSRSPVFDAMLYGAMAEQGDIRVDDARPDDFKELLSFIYTDNLELNPINIVGLLYLSTKYMIPRQTSKCIEYLHSILSPENACQILDHTMIYEDETLIENCLKMIQVYTKAAFESETMLDIKKETLIMILDCEILTMKESDVFNACLRWAKHQVEQNKDEATGTNLRNVLGDCIQKIGYANMGNKDFAHLVVPTGILSIEEETAIFRFIGSKDLHPPPQNFLCTQRNRNFPLNIITSEKIEQVQISRYQIPNASIVSNTDVEVKSLFIGDRRMTVHFDNNTLNVTEKIDVDDTMQEWKLGSSITLQKDQKHSLEFNFNNALFSIYSSSYRNNDVEVFAVKRAKIIVGDDIVELKLASDKPFLPVFGFKYTLAILDTPVKLNSRVQKICKTVQGWLFHFYSLYLRFF